MASKRRMKRHLDRQCKALIHLYDQHDTGEKHKRFLL